MEGMQVSQQPIRRRSDSKGSGFLINSSRGQPPTTWLARFGSQVEGYGRRNLRTFRIASSSEDKRVFREVSICVYMIW
jgi:hypothetical protein